MDGRCRDRPRAAGCLAGLVPAFTFDWKHLFYDTLHQRQKVENPATGSNGG